MFAMDLELYALITTIDLPMPEFDNPPNLKNAFDKPQANSQPLPLPSIGELTSHIR